MTTATKIQRREFLQLADTFDAVKHDIAGFYISEKLDGGRCFWDGGISRGVPTVDVPWAGLLEPKTGNPKDKVKPTASGLWSRYGNPIAAPEWFLNQLPCCPLDGELYAGRGNFQTCMSAIRKDVANDKEWKKIGYAVYSSPPLERLFQAALIKNNNMLCDINRKACWEFFHDHKFKHYDFLAEDVTFEQELLFLREAIETQNDHVYLHLQTKLPMNPAEARAAAEEHLSKVLDLGGEGCVIRDGSAMWTPKRHRGLLKFKPFEDAEARVVGYVTGRQGKQGNVLGKIGALKVKAIGLKGVEFEIGSGLTMKDRELASPAATVWAEAHPEQVLPQEFDGKYLRRGQTITFKYRELSDDGVPKEGRYWRRRESE
jgi:DNA ligase-1